MAEINILRKSLDGLYYRPGKPDVGYDINLLAANNPHARFVVINEDRKIPHSNVYTKADIMDACNMDDKLQMRCPQCSKKNRYDRSMCRGCGEEMPYHGMLVEIFGDDYLKALTEQQIHDQFSTSDKKFMKGAFAPYYTSKIGGDPFLQLLNAAFFNSETE